MSDEFEMFTDSESFEDREFFLAEETLLDVKNKREKFKKKKEEIENLKYEQDLIEKDIIESIRDSLGMSAYNIFRSFVPEIFDDSWRYARHLTEHLEYNKKSLEKYKTSYELITTLIKSNLIPEKYRDSVTFGQIWACGYYSDYEYYMSINDFEFIINIPVFSAMDKTSYMRALNGYELRKLEGCVNSIIYNNLDYREFSKYLESWLDEQLEHQNKLNTK